MKRTALAFVLSAIAAQASAVPILQNTSFETNNVGSSYKYAGDVTAAPWTFTGGVGISHDNTAWGGITASGDYFAFLQTLGQATSSITQVFSSDGNYELDFSFDLVDRTNYGSQNQVVEVVLDGTVYASINASTSWTTFNLMNVAIGAGSHTLEFRGTNPQNANDASTFLDNIQMTATASQVPEPASLALLGLGLAGLVISRRRKY